MLLGGGVWLFLFRPATDNTPINQFLGHIRHYLAILVINYQIKLSWLKRANKNLRKCSIATFFLLKNKPTKVKKNIASVDKINVFSKKNNSRYYIFCKSSSNSNTKDKSLVRFLTSNRR